MAVLADDVREKLQTLVQETSAANVAERIGLNPMTFRKAREGAEVRAETVRKVLEFLGIEQAVAHDCGVAIGDTDESVPETERKPKPEATVKVPLRQLMTCMTEEQLETVVAYGQALLNKEV